MPFTSLSAARMIRVRGGRRAAAKQRELGYPQLAWMRQLAVIAKKKKKLDKLMQQAEALMNELNADNLTDNTRTPRK